MKKFVACFFLLKSVVLLGQNNQQIINKLPDYIPPTPEVSALLKADNLNVGFATGSPNVTISVFNFKVGDYSLPLTLNYSLTGIKVDEVASMAGMGWTFNYGGVISRTVMDKPDEDRDEENCNLNSIDAGTPNQTLYDFLVYAPDKQSDIFSFSFPGYSGKFIIGLTNDIPIQLTKNNLRILPINSNFLNGFIITTDDGTSYYFEDEETSTSRNPYGSNCEKTYDASSVKTSWYLSKIILPSTMRQINFTYTTSTVDFESSISQTISKITYSESYPCSTSPTGFACEVGSERFSTCIDRQLVTSKFVTKIESNDGDKVDISYDATPRTDLNGGKRLKEIKVTNRNGLVINITTLYSSYQNAISGSGYESKRLFLDSIGITGSDAGAVPLKYRFAYVDYGSLPPRLSYGQDWYGYYNGKNSNLSLLPILASTDVNYSIYNNGTGGDLATFGDRSIDTTYSLKGLLKRVEYPTGGYDSILYIANRTLRIVSGSETEVLAGGHSVLGIKSYAYAGSLALAREFYYRNKSDNKPSSFLLTNNLQFSQLNSTKKNGFVCSGGIGYCDGPSCSYAVVTSNANHPITTFGSQHVYHRSVMERSVSDSGDNGISEHLYSYFNGGNLTPYHRQGNYILNASYQIIPDILIGETNTNIYKREGTAYSVVLATERKFRLDSLDEYINYIVRKNYDRSCLGNPLTSADFEPFDIEEVYLNQYTTQLDTVIEKEYLNDNQVLIKTTIMEYNGPYTYATRVLTTGSDNLEEKVERKYVNEFPPLGYMVNRNILSPVIEEKSYRNNVLTITRTNSFNDWFSDEKIILPDTTEVKLYNNAQVQRVIFYSYDTQGNVLEVSKEKDQVFSYIWDLNKSFPVAKVQNANYGSIAYTSFEADGKGNWTFSGTPSSETTAPTGKMGYSLSGGSITKSGLGSGIWIVSYWSKDSVQNVNSTSAVSGRAVNGWRYYEHLVTNPASGTITVSGSGTIDELRLYPSTAQMTTLTFEPLLGATSQCDINNRIVYYEYDAFGRLTVIRDQDKNIVKTIDYRYQASISQ